MANDDLKSAAGDLVKRVLSVGVGAIFLTEESLRGLVSEMKIPKELLGGILESANKTKNEFLGKLSNDLIDRVTQRLDPQALVEEILQKHEIEIKVSFRPKAGRSVASAPPSESSGSGGELHE